MRRRQAGAELKEVTAPPLDKRLERFVQRYIDSPLKVEILRTLARRPNRLYTLSELATFAQDEPAAIERAVFQLDHLGLVSTRQRQDNLLIGLSHSPVVRDMAIKLFRYTSNPGGSTKIAKLVRGKRS